MQMDGRQDEKFAHYVEELKSVMKALTLGRVPAGYELEDSKNIKDILDKHKMDGEMYEQSQVALQNIEVVMITTTIERIADVGEKIGEEKGKRDREIEEQRKERASRMRGRTRSTLEKE